MRNVLTVMLGSAFLGACGAADTSNQAAQSAQPEGYSPTQQKVVDLPEKQRFGVLFRAIHDGGAPCQSVVQEVRQPDRNGVPSYVARCQDGPHYAVAIAANGMAEVTRLDR